MKRAEESQRRVLSRLVLAANVQVAELRLQLPDAGRGQAQRRQNDRCGLTMPSLVILRECSNQRVRRSRQTEHDTRRCDLQRRLPIHWQATACVFGDDLSDDRAGARS